MGLKILENVHVNSKNNSKSYTASQPNDMDTVFQYRTSINGTIDEFFQGQTGNCYMLAQLLGLRDNLWGKEIVKQAIKSDGMGGAIVTLKGANGGLKEIRVSEQEILNIRKKQSFEEQALKNTKVIDSLALLKREEQVQYFKGNRQFSTGDDDVLALELAILKYNKTQGNNSIEGGAHEKRYGDIIYLLSGNLKYNRYIKPTVSNNGDDLIKLTEEIENNPTSSINYVSFEEGNALDFLASHAYELKSIKTDKNGHKVITFVNPHNSSEEIKADYYDALKSIKDIYQWKNIPNETELEYYQNYGYIDDNSLDTEEFNKKLEKYKYSQEYSDCKMDSENKTFMQKFRDFVSKLKNHLKAIFGF